MPMLKFLMLNLYCIIMLSSENVKQILNFDCHNYNQKIPSSL